MKTYLTYGLAAAVANALLLLTLYFLGLHSDPAKLNTAQWIGVVGVCVIAVVFLVLGIKARRASVPPTEEFGYGRALGTGVMIMLFSALFGIITNALYYSVINPEFTEIAVQAQVTQLESRGLPPDALERAERGVRFMMKPPVLAIAGFVMAMIGGTCWSLVTAAFLKRPATQDFPS